MKKICRNCGNEFETRTKDVCCSQTCKTIYYNHRHFPDGSDYVECKECGFRAKQVSQHVVKKHGMSIDEYCNKHNCLVSELTCKTLHDTLSANIRKACADGKCGFKVGGENPSHSEEVKSGRRSIFSMNYHGYDGLTDEEKRKRISEASNNVAKKRDDNCNSTTTIEYYLKRGYSKTEAKKMLKERQSTFTLEKCKKKYGDVDGERIYNERQQKWQDTLKSKPIEEIERINKAKMCDGRGYSKISQELFNSIMNILGDEYKEVFYATNGGVDNPFNEYMVVDDIHNRHYFLDFYVKDNNKVIEFDGEYWHSEKRGSWVKKHELEREDNLRTLGYSDILHVGEREYRDNPDKVIVECVEFIRRRN